MANALTEPATAPGGSPVRPRGVLATALPAPEGWESGGVEVSVTCPSPVVRDKCISMTDTASRPTLEQFPAFMIEQGSTCSTLTGTDREAEARAALEQSTDYALGLNLATGVANGATSLADATVVGTGDFLDAVAAVAALECAAASTGQGEAYMLHATVGAAAYLVTQGLIDDNGLSPSGARWIISTGYECDGEAPHQIWATGRVWAAAGQLTTYQDVERRQNNREAWAVRSAVVGFNTCINLTATFTV